MPFHPPPSHTDIKKQEDIFKTTYFLNQIWEKNVLNKNW